MKRRSLPGVNIQFPISRLIVSGDKTVETRTYPLPKHYVGQPMFLVETPGSEGNFPARAVAVIEFGEPFIYSSEKEFWSDAKNHCVDKNSKWKWNDKPKWGWPINKVEPLKYPIALKGPKGIRFTKSINLTF